MSGTNAEQNYGSDVYHEVPPRTTSENVISNVSTAGTDVTIAGIGYDQSAAPFSLGTGSPVDASRPVLGEHRAERLARILSCRAAVSARIRDGPGGDLQTGYGSIAACPTCRPSASS